MEKLAKLKKMKIFSNFSDDELKEVARVAVEKIYPSNVAIIEENRESPGLFLTESGEVHVVKKMSPVSDMGRETIAKLGPGDHFGEMSLIDGKPASASVIASEPTICFVIKNEVYKKMIKEHPIIALKMYQFFAMSLCDRLRRTDAFLMEELLKKYKSSFDKSLLSGGI